MKLYTPCIMMKLYVNMLAAKSIPKNIPIEFTINLTNGLYSGMDAQVSYAFHSERKLHPENFKNQLTNQVLI